MLPVAKNDDGALSSIKFWFIFKGTWTQPRGEDFSCRYSYTMNVWSPKSKHCQNQDTLSIQMSRLRDCVQKSKQNQQSQLSKIQTH